jgi:hypothetical protein
MSVMAIGEEPHVKNEEAEAGDTGILSLSVT